jgi:TolA-binding protein
MKKLIFILAFHVSAIACFAQQKTAAHYWGRVPSQPSATKESFQTFLDDCETLIREIGEEAGKQNKMVEEKAATVNVASIQMPQNMDPAAVQKMMQKIQRREVFRQEVEAKGLQFRSRLDSITSSFEKAYAAKIKPLEDKESKTCPSGAMSEADYARLPACDAVRKELDKARAHILKEYFTDAKGPFQGYLADLSAWLKKIEPQIIQFRDKSFEGTGINVKGLPCAQTITDVSIYLADLKTIFWLPLSNQLVQ